MGVSRAALRARARRGQSRPALRLLQVRKAAIALANGGEEGASAEWVQAVRVRAEDREAKSQGQINTGRDSYGAKEATTGHFDRGQGARRGRECSMFKFLTLCSPFLLARTAWPRVAVCMAEGCMAAGSR